MKSNQMNSTQMNSTQMRVDFVLHNENAQRFLSWVKDTGVPDETFFASLNVPQLGVPGATTCEGFYDRW